MADMKYLVTADEMKTYDNHTIQKLGIPACVLMERAALAVADETMRRFGAVTENGRMRRVLIAAGCGNNGGDGIATGRLLHDNKYKVDVILIGDRQNCSQETERQIKIIENYGMDIGSKIPEEEYDIIVDAVFGIGITRNIEGKYADAINRINASSAYKVSVDVPSGIHADTGYIQGCAVKANLTVTFAFCKRGLVLYPGASYAGEVICRDIGIGERSFDGLPPQMYTYEDTVSDLLPQRPQDGNKGTFGKVLLVAGSLNMAGAALLAGRSAYRAGAGMVKIVTPDENRLIIQEALPEALLLTYSCEELSNAAWQDAFEASLSWADVIAVGPGLSVREEARKLLMLVFTMTEKPLVLDADALNLLAVDEDMQSALAETAKGKDRQLILTPHMGELARLLGMSIQDTKNSIIENAIKAAEKYACTVACKDARTVVCRKESRSIYVNTAGNSGMATAGSGDVLTGIIAAIMAQSKDSFLSAAAGVYLHARAGDIAAGIKGEAGVMATDLIESLTLGV